MQEYDVMLAVQSMEGPLSDVVSRRMYLAGSVPFKPAKDDFISVVEAAGTRVGVKITRVDWQPNPAMARLGLFWLSAVPDQDRLRNGTMPADRICKAFEASGWSVRHVFDVQFT